MEVEEGQMVSVDTHAGRYVATVLTREEDSCDGDMWQVQYVDGGYKERLSQGARFRTSRTQIKSGS